MSRELIYVGMSGGVDSSVTAALLKQAGHEVVGVFARGWEPANEELARACTWREERREAMRVSAHLDIPLITLDTSQEYKQKVVDYMLAEYQAGRTPNPDILCNQEIKFGVMLEAVLKAGATKLATGHYAQVEEETGQYILKTSNDPEKDQTYFLWTLTQSQLKNILFPVGGYTKEAVRKLARKSKLPNADKKDSQGLCFVGQVDVKDFLQAELGKKSGRVLNKKGEVIGEHDGALFYTIGERHGFTINNQTPNQEPLYVISKNIKANTITVASAPSDKSKNTSSKIELEKVNWVSGVVPSQTNLTCRIRHRGDFLPCKLEVKDNKTTVILATSRSDIAPGQSLVLYDVTTCIGGGVIV
ncbi:MAG: tRNA 2-thiouridine(34) synthase MnmA [Candidatus Vogelbacteria bacterium]|nr:tRNA 2-thiouridine(34) synthase MnmA [Candidatus Vogelbacteria bacterium]